MKTKMRLLIICMSFIASFQLTAQTPGFEWAGQMGGDSTVQATRVAVDAAGNQVIIGSFRDTVDFDPDPNNTFNLIAKGYCDIFIQKLDTGGALIWAASIGDTFNMNERGAEVVTDAAGNIYAIGYFWGTTDVDPGDGEYILSQNRWTTMVLKINPDGDLIWGKQMGSETAGHAYGWSIAVDNSGNVFTSGSFYGRVDFDPGPGVVNLTCTSNDTFIQKLDQNGNFIWVKQIIGTEYKFPYCMATDVSGNIYTCGYFKGTVDFNPDRKLKYNLTSFGDYDAFVLKLTGNGSFTWARQVGGTAQDLCYSIAFDPSGYLYATGHFYGTADFNPGTGTYNLTSFGGNDAYVLKLDLSGNFVSAKQYGGTSYDSADDIILDGEGNYFISGYFYGTSDFDPGAGTYYLTANGHDDSFVLKSDLDGNTAWAIQAGGPGWDFSMALAVDAAGNIINVGSFEETADFDPGGNSEFEMTNVNVRDIFVQKLNPDGGDACPVPVALAVSNITENVADLSWNGVSGATGYYVRYREIGTEWINSEIVAGTNLTISGLVPITAYEFQVRTNCFSNYSYSFEFMTPGGCPDNYEPNETMGAAAPIAVNTDITALIGTNGDQDWFSFSTTNTAKNIQITLTNLPLDYNLRLFKSDGTFLGSSINTGTTPESITYNSVKVGSYRIWVGGLSSDTYDPVNCYTLKAATSSTAYKSAEAEIQDPDATAELTVYPNPSNTAFNFIYKTSSQEPISLQLFDMSGRLIQEIQSVQPNEIITAGGNLEYGIYLAVVTQGTVKKFVKIARVQ